MSFNSFAIIPRRAGPNTALGYTVNPNTALGQGDYTALPETPPINLTIREQYDRLRSWCKDNYGDAFCDSIFPDNPIYLPPRQEEKFTKSPVFWIIVGAVLAKVLLRW